MPISSWAKVKVLVWADIVPYFVLWMLLTYLTDVWNLNFTRSAEIVNFFYGMVAIMPVAMQLIVDTILGDYWMVVLSSFAYSAGLGLLTMSTPPVLSRVTGNCSVYESQCLGPVQKLLFYTALLLIALGMAGHLTSVQTLIDSERRTTSPTPSTLFAFLVWTLKVFGPLFVGWALGLIKSWWVLFAIAAVTSLGAMAVFLTGSYVERPEARDSALTTMLRVFVASAFKTFLTHPGWDKLYGANDNNIDQIPYTPRLRFLDKAAIKLPAQENNRWRLCRVTEVEETKSLIYMLPVCLNFIPMGVVASIGNTYFVEQANQDANVPVIFLSLHEYAKAASLLFVDEIPREKLLILASMTCTVLCCIVAGTVENRRLSVGRSHGLLDNPSQHYKKKGQGLPIHNGIP